jgi:uncharacterized protein
MNAIAPLRWWPAVLLIITVFTGITPAQVRYPARIGQREFVLDVAGVISQTDRGPIRAAAAASLDRQGAPIVVVTINSLADYGAAGLTTQAYAEGLFNDWGIGAAGGSRGVLMLVAVKDRRVWIATGRAWGHTIDSQCGQIVDGTLRPAFRSGDYSGGIRAGVDGLARLLGGAGTSTATVQSRATPATVPAGGPGPSYGLLLLLCPIAAIVGVIALASAAARNARRARGEPGGIGWFGDAGGSWGGGGFCGGGDGGAGACGGGDCGGGGAGGGW